jgi:uncharacterized membrane protein
MKRLPSLIVSSFFALGGIAHFVSADFFVAMMPDYLPYHWELVIISGVFEIMGAIALQIPKTREFASYGLMLLCVAVFPANLNMALNANQFPDIPLVMLYLRLPFQLLIIWFIWWSAKILRNPAQVEKN